MKTTVCLCCALLMSAGAAFAQPQIDVPLTITDGIQSTVLHFGILPWAHYCIDPSDSINGHAEEFLPPLPPVGVFDGRFVSPHPQIGPPYSCFDLGSWCDFRPFISAAQRDTFKLTCQQGDGPRFTVSWPSGLSAYFTELRMGNINMLVDTMYVDSAGSGSFPPKIYSGGLVVSVGQPSPNGPEEFVLHQNYPNPFNPSTKIEFALPTSGHVKLAVYDVLGREFATLVDAHLLAGNHEAIFAPKGLTSGVYFYVLRTAGTTITRKMLLMK